MHNRLSRAEVPVETTWDLSDLFASESAWEAEMQAVDHAHQAVSVYQGQLGCGASQLLACLSAEETLYTRLTRVGTFANLRNAQDGTNPLHQAASARVSALFARVGASTSFIDS